MRTSVALGAPMATSACENTSRTSTEGTLRLNRSGSTPISAGGALGTKSVAAAASAEAKRLKAGGAIAIVDEGGNLLYLERLEGTFPAAQFPDANFIIVS